MNLRRSGILVILVVCLAAVLLSGCARLSLVAVDNDKIPSFADDLDRDSLQKAVLASLDYLRNQPPEKKFFIGEQTYPVSRLTATLEHFLGLLAAHPSGPELDRLIKEHYLVFQSTGSRGFNPGRRMLVTGYFQPVIPGSLTKQGSFVYPLYCVPTDLVKIDSAGTGEAKFGRLVDGRPVPYWTRREIETTNRLAGAELVWLQDPFDAFVLHVQGSGLIRLQDGTFRGVHYAAKNGRPYRSIGKYLVDTGRMKLEEASLETIRDYIHHHPEEREEILHHNPSFIFFSWTDTFGAMGNLGRELTPGRSIAVDQGCFPAGALAFLRTRKPLLEEGKKAAWQPLQRFVLVQDTGSAIRGPGRIDLFWGRGDLAGLEAGMMREKGTLYFLLLKEEVTSLASRN